MTSTDPIQAGVALPSHYHLANRPLLTKKCPKMPIVQNLRSLYKGAYNVINHKWGNYRPNHYLQTMVFEFTEDNNAHM